MTLQLLGLTGLPGVGKDTVASLLYPLGFRAQAFADELRREVSLAFRVDPRLLMDRATKELPVPAFAIGMCDEPHFVAWAARQDLDLVEPRSARWIVQRWGTDFRRAQDIDYWVRPAEHWLRRMQGLGRRHLVITDVRYPNEAELVQRHGGTIIELTMRRDVSAMPPATRSHTSNDGVAGYVRAALANDDTLQALDANVRALLLEIYGPTPLNGEQR